ncbi:SAVMC3_10250 family protein [Streptomyces violaceorubidus]|uniref:SAVMC3_10250 family protein n=1 Tax=Streptomyces violaceorubidus TaxID=284042 RepID=A0ABV1T359_9ACTN
MEGFGARRCRGTPGGAVKELLYLSEAKLGEFFSGDKAHFTDRAVETEVSALGAGLRVAVGETPTGQAGLGQKLEQVLAHVRGKCDAHTSLPASCESLAPHDWLEFAGFFRHGARLRDWGLDDRGVYTFTSFEDPPCVMGRGGDACAGVQVILCGSRRHVLAQSDASPTRMGSGSDWLHDLAADLAEREAQGDTSLPETLHATSRRDKEFAARSAYDMLLTTYEGPAYLHGHARVLCNFPPDVWQHRLIVATPLYVEAVQRPRRGGVELRAGTRASMPWRQRLPRLWRRNTIDGS